MSNKGKIFIGCGIALLIPVIALIGLVYYIGTDEEYMEQHKFALEEGKNFGKTTDQEGCMQEGLRRNSDIKNPSIKDLSLHGRFVNECLRTSKTNQNFCKNVPKIIVRDWINNQCSQIGKEGNLFCYVVFDEKTTYCAGL